MISLIIKSYITILLAVGGGSAFILLLGFYLIFKQPRSKKAVAALAVQDVDSVDFSAIAGDDVITTQLDLARAYIETGSQSLAKNILVSVMAEGSAEQQAEAQRLLTSVVSG